MPEHGEETAQAADSLSRAIASRIGIVCIAAFVGAIVGALDFIIHQEILSLYSPGQVHAVFDAVIIGSSSSIIMMVTLLAFRERRRKLLRDMDRVAQLNHQVRNALELIVHSQQLPQREQSALVMESVTRIEMALRELFPAVHGNGTQQRRHFRHV